jgi:hypothetical protein
MERELSRIGWSAEFFRAIRPDSAGEFPSIGARGCFLSHLAVLKKARDIGVQRLIVLEDDVNFVREFPTRWKAALKALEAEKWMLFYPGHALDDLPTGLSPLSPSTGVQGAHFILINGSAIPRLINSFEVILSRPPGHPMGGPMHVDGAYSTVRLQNADLATFAYFPVLGIQRPSATDIGARKWFDRVDGLKPIVRLFRVFKGQLTSARDRFWMRTWYN